MTRVLAALATWWKQRLETPTLECDCGWTYHGTQPMGPGRAFERHLKHCPLRPHLCKQTSPGSHGQPCQLTANHPGPCLHMKRPHD